MVASVIPEQNKFQIEEHIKQSIFRAYDIRGVVETELTPNAVFTIGLAFGSIAQENGQKTVIIGRDARESSPILFHALSSGLIQTGCDVIDIGIVPTPLLYFATNQLDSKTGVMITGSHNPVEYNGLKMVLNGVTISTDAVQSLYHRIKSNNFNEGHGKLTRFDDIIADYINTVVKNVKLEKPLHIVVDAGNGVGGLVAPALYRKLGCKVDELYCDIDGRFPNHHPDPTIPKNLVDLQKMVVERKADIGLAFDGDADRLGVVLNTGEVIWPDRQLMLLAKHVYPRYKGEAFVFDVKCSAELPKVVKKYGGEPLMYRTGHSVLKQKMIDMHAPLSGELSGHIFFKDRWFGFDDGIYVGARLLEILSKEHKTAAEVFGEFPTTVSTPELKVNVPEDKKTEILEKLKQGFLSKTKGKIITIDGLRVEFDNGWGLVRASNTTPCLTLRFEANTEENLEQIKSLFRQMLHYADENLSLSF
jgi:phosphomannomutase / phosphoglucomutase